MRYLRAPRRWPRDPCRKRRGANSTARFFQTAKSSDAVKISNGFTLRMGNFARIAQTAFLLSQALRAVRASADLPGDGEAEPDQTAQLRRTLLALVHAADNEGWIRRLEFCAQSALSLRSVISHLCLPRQESGDSTNDEYHVPHHIAQLLALYRLENPHTHSTLRRSDVNSIVSRSN